MDETEYLLSFDYMASLDPQQKRAIEAIFETDVRLRRLERFHAGDRTATTEVFVGGRWIGFTAEERNPANYPKILEDGIAVMSHNVGLARQLGLGGCPYVQEIARKYGIGTEQQQLK